MRYLLLIFILSSAFLNGQKIAVYKMAALEKRIAHPDTVYIVNFWATWCKPCVKELPAFDSVHVLNKDRPVRVLLVSLDFREDLRTKLIPFIQRKKVQAECVLLDESNGNDFINRVHPAWSGAIPGTLLSYHGRKIFEERPLNLSQIEALIVQIKR